MFADDPHHHDATRSDHIVFRFLVAADIQAVADAYEHTWDWGEGVSR